MLVPTLEEKLHRLLIERQKTLSLAESCTGGALAARITRLSGCSQYFLGSMVTYSNFLKMKVLGVEEAVLIKHGAVSEPVVRQMAEGVQRLTESDYSVAVSGIAGPSGGTPSKPIGTIWIALSDQGRLTIAKQFQLKGERSALIKESVDLILKELIVFID